MKIKTKKQLNLSQLIDYIWDNDIKNECFRRLNRGPFEYVWVNEDSNIEFDDYMLFRKNDIFEIEVEEEIMEDTVIEKLYHTIIPSRIVESGCSTIKSTLEHSTVEPIAFYILNDDLTMTLIWTHEKGLVK